MDNQNQRSDELFETLNKNKKKKKRRLLRTVLTVIAVILVIIVIAVSMLRREVEERFADAAAEVLTYEVKPGTIHTLVTGSGTLTEVDLETINVPEGVEITDVLVEEGDSVRTGDLLATVDLSTVMTAMAELQKQVEELDVQIAEAKSDEVDDRITAGLSGRVKLIYAQEDMDVGVCMAEHGALAVLSLDSHMAVDIECDTLVKDQLLDVILSDGTKTPAIVGKVSRGIASVLVTDNGTVYGDQVTVCTKEGEELGTGSLYIYQPLAITGYAGTIKSIPIWENQYVDEDTPLFRLKDTSFSANYDALLRQRQELEEELMELLTIYRDGAVLSPMDAVVSSVSFGAEASSGTDDSALAGSNSLAAMYGASMGQTQTMPAAESEGILVLYPDLKMDITIGVGETDILALQIGQESEVLVSSVSKEPYSGIVTQINKEANTSMGVTQYSAVITVDKAAGMLPGMTADVDVRIEGVENALIIPLDALHETSTMSYVYTTYDEETMQYGGMVEVTTGMRNDSFVEITSGLSEGDIIRYTEAQFDFFAFINSQFGGMGGSGQYLGMGG